MARVRGAWEHALKLASADGKGRTVVVVGHAMTHNAMMALALGLPSDKVNLFRNDTGGITVLDFPDGTEGVAVVRAMNFTAHLGRWAVPVTQDEEELVCGIDGCF